MKMYEVGGCVRDEILGVKSKDIDYSVVFDYGPHFFEKTDPFRYMEWRLASRGFEIFLSTPEFLTVRARFPKGHVNSGITADFVLARKESDYTDGRRPDHVEPGTLLDDLARRDFTMNAIAKDADGNYIDPHGGLEDIRYRRIVAVGNPLDRLQEDPLRALRAIRFAVTKKFDIDDSLWQVLQDQTVLEGIRNLSDERIREELSKMFRFDTRESITWLGLNFPYLADAVFDGQVSLDATMKTRGRG